MATLSKEEQEKIKKKMSSRKYREQCKRKFEESQRVRAPFPPPIPTAVLRTLPINKNLTPVLPLQTIRGLSEKVGQLEGQLNAATQHITFLQNLVTRMSTALPLHHTPQPFSAVSHMSSLPTSGPTLPPQLIMRGSSHCQAPPHSRP